MNYIESNFKSFSDYASHFIGKLTNPNPAYVKDQIQYELATMRNKSVLFVQILLMLLYIADTIINQTPVKVNITRFGASILIIFVLAISCKYHPQIFKAFFTSLCLAYGPLIMLVGEEGIIKAWLSGLILPASYYVFSGSLGHFIVQIIIQNVFLTKLYLVPMERALLYLPPEVLLETLKQVSVRISFYTVFFVMFSHYFMQKASQRVLAMEKKKDELESQKTFLLSFSHELRNLINSLTGNIKLASLVENISPRVKELLLNAEVCGEVLLHLVNNILDTGKVEIGELEINLAPTRIYDTIEKVWGVCSELIKRKNIQGKIKIPNDLPKTLMIDHYRLTQILLNLVGNSIKFTESGTIDINISWINSEQTPTEKCFQPYPFNERDEHDEGLFEKQKSFSFLDPNLMILDFTSRRINPSLLRKSITITGSGKGILKIVVSDTGCGMNEHEINQLFQKFSQVSSDATKRRLGTGLGLFITKELCTKMQGEIIVFSKKNKGSSFILCLPVDSVPEEDNHEELWDLEYLRNFITSQKLRAMIVDDISFNHTVLKCFFDKLGIEVIDIAINGLEAYQKYVELTQQGDRPHIITMDLDMPVMDGKEATRRIREFESQQGLERCFLPIISGNCTESEIAGCLDNQGSIKADCFIKKPASLEELLRVIGQHFIQVQRR